MSEPLDFVVFSVNSWQAWHDGGFRTRNARVFQSLRQFEDSGQVLHVETFPKSLLPRANQRRRTLVECTHGQALPIAWPHALVRVDAGTAALQLSRTLMYRAPQWASGVVRRACDELGLRDPALVVYDPAAARMFSHLPSRLRLVDADFNWIDHGDLVKRGRGALERGYECIRQQADVVVRVSDRPFPLLEGPPVNEIIANGFDARLFRRGHEEPVSLQSIPRPRAGYVGTIQGRVDLDLLTQVARLRPNVSWILLGPVWESSDVAALKALPNVFLLGAKTHDRVPAYVEALDVGLIVHRDDALTASMDPLKLYEYLAMGIPVVSTPVAGIEPFTRFVRVARTAETFAAAVDMALDEASDRKEERQASVEDCSWEHRLRKLHALIREHRHAPNTTRTAS